MIITSEYDAAVFRIFGGHAIIREEICRRCFPDLIVFQGPSHEYGPGSLQTPF